MLEASVKHDDNWTDLVSKSPKRVHIAFLCGLGILHPEASQLGVRQFRGRAVCLRGVIDIRPSQER